MLSYIFEGLMLAAFGGWCYGWVKDKKWVTIISGLLIPVFFFVACLLIVNGK